MLFQLRPSGASPRHLKDFLDLKNVMELSLHSSIISSHDLQSAFFTNHWKDGGIFGIYQISHWLLDQIVPSLCFWHITRQVYQRTQFMSCEIL